MMFDELYKKQGAFSMRIDGKQLGEEQCENMKEVVAKHGVTIVCDEEDEKETADFIMPAGEDCENMKEVASKVGKMVVCDEEA